MSDENSNIPSKYALSRRGFLKGATALVAAAALPSVLSLEGCKKDSDAEVPADSIETLMVSADELISFSDFDTVETGTLASLTSTFTLAAGSMLWMATEDRALVLAPTGEARPLSRLSLLNIQNGDQTPLLDAAVRASEGYEIYEARASESLLLWTECKYLTNDWLVYAQRLNDTSLSGDPVLLDEGDSDFDPPLLCAAGSDAIWTYMPNENGGHSKDKSLAKKATLDAPSPETLFTSSGRMATIPEMSDGRLAITPRVDTSGVYYQLMALDPTGSTVVDTTVLPKGVKPQAAIYMAGHFAFCIPASYDSESAIAQTGSYFDMGDGSWFRHAKAPLCTPAQCKGRLLVKNGKGVAVVDVAKRCYEQIDAPDTAWNYGDYLAGAGTQTQLVVYSTVSSPSDASDAAVTVRVFDIV